MRKRTNPEGAPASVEDCIVSLVRDSFPYTGQPITPQVTVTTQDGVPLVVNVDYFVSYSDNINVGAGTVTITGAGEYVGSVIKTFQITSAEPVGNVWQDFDLSLTEHVSTVESDDNGWTFNRLYGLSITSRQNENIMLMFAAGNDSNSNRYRVCRLEQGGYLTRISSADESGNKTSKHLGRFSSDGTKFAVITDSGSTLSEVFSIIPCSTPFEVSSEDTASAYEITCDVYLRSRTDIRTSPNMDKAIIFGQTGSSEGYSWRLTSFDISGASAVRTSYFTSPHSSSLYFDVSPDGGAILMMTWDKSGNVTLEKYSLSTAWDVSTMTLVSSYVIPELSIAVSYAKGLAVDSKGERLAIFRLNSPLNESRYIEIYNLKKQS